MNIEEKKKIPRLIKWYLGFKPGPLRVDFMLTDKCNQKCVYCYLFDHKHTTKGEFSTDRIVQIIREAKGLGVYNWNITGVGEPMTCKEKVLSAVYEIKKLGMFGNLTTNGTLFDKFLIKKFVSLKWDCITFSIDSPEKNIQDGLRGQKGSLQKAEEALEEFKKVKSQLKIEKPTIVIHSVITNKNYNHIKKLIRFAKEKGAEKLEITQVMPLSRYAKNLMLNPKELECFQKSIPQLLDYSENIDLETNLKSYLNGELIKKSKDMRKIMENDVKSKEIKINCFSPLSSLIILSNGDVGPCCLFSQKIGNIYESSLKDIWFGEKLKKFRKRMLLGKVLKCKNCPSTEMIRNREIRERLERNLILKITAPFIRNKWANACS